MRRILFHVGMAALCAAAISCGPAPEPVAPAQPAPLPVATATAQPAAAELDLSPVKEPADIVGVARWKSPNASMGSLAACAGLPPAIFDAGAKAGVRELVKEIVRGSADADELAAVVAMDAPVDAVAVLDPSPKKPNVLGAFSIGLVSLERAKQAAEAKGPLVELAPGIWKIGAKSERRDLSCAVAASAGSAPARLVCGDRDKDVTALGPYLARNLATAAPAGGDVHGELRFSPIETRYGGLLRQALTQLPLLAQTEALGEPKFDRALVEAATGLQDELGALSQDLDKITLDVAVGSAACLSTSGSIELRGKKSWFASTVAERPERAGPPPALFWRAPKDSDMVVFGRAGDPARYAPIVKTLRALAEGALDKARIGTPADRKALVELIDLPLGKDTNSVQASGHIDAGPPKDKGSSQQVFEGLLSASLGWSLFGVDEDSKALSKMLKNVLAVVGRASLLAPVRKELGKDAKFLPTVKSVPPPPKLGKGAMDIEIAIKDIPVPDLQAAGAKPSPGAGGKKKEANIKLSIHVLLMDDGKTTWVAIGADREELVKRLLSVREGAPQKDMLGTRGGLEALRNAKLMSGGFFTIGAFTRSIGSGLSYALSVAPPGSVTTEAHQAMQILHSLPHRGETPILLTSTTSGGSAPKAQFSLQVPKDAVEDLTAVIVNGLKLKR